MSDTDEIIKKLLMHGTVEYQYHGRAPIDVSDWNMEHDSVYHDVITDAVHDDVFDEEELERNFKCAYITGPNDRFEWIARKLLKLPKELHEVYRDWLWVVYDIDPDSLPIDSSTACQSSVSLPRPSGKVWRLLLNSVQNKEDRVIEDKLVKAVTDMAMRAAIETERLERGTRA